MRRHDCTRHLPSGSTWYHLRLSIQQRRISEEIENNPKMADYIMWERPSR
jgi:hypothetical protein